MVTEKKIGNKKVFLCDICGLGYSEKNIAQDCEDYCKAHAGSCSVEITKKAVYFPDIPILPKNSYFGKNGTVIAQPPGFPDHLHCVATEKSTFLISRI